MQSLLSDVRHALRMLRRAPLFSALVVATLALASARTPRSSASSTPCCSASLPYRRAGAAGRALRRDRVAAGAVRVLGARSRRVPGARAQLRRARGFPQRRVRAVRRAAAGTRPRGEDIGVAARRPRCRAGARPRLHGRGRHRPAAGRDPVRRSVAARVRRRFVGGRQVDLARPPAVHHRRRHAARLHVSESRAASQQRSGGRLRPDLVQSGRARGVRRPCSTTR